MTGRPVLVPGGRPVVVPDGVEVLGPFADAGVFGAYEVQFAAAVLRVCPGLGAEEILALATAARAPRFGHVCTSLEDMGGRLAELDGEEVEPLPWPTGATWAAALVDSEVVAGPDRAYEQLLRPLVWDGDRLYLHRYWHYELAIAADLTRRGGPSRWASTGSPSGEVDPGAAEVVLDLLFPPGGAIHPDLQRLAARRALTPGVSIIAGGPGTGKTYTVARLLAAAHLMAADGGRDLTVALAAPTGKAAARMGEAVGAAVAELPLDGAAGAVVDRLTSTDPTTVHALLGWQDRTHFRHDRLHPLPHDMVIIDETSMVSVPLMAKLLDAVRPEASVVLVGDPFQLASIEAGTVMSDLVGPGSEPGTPSEPGPPVAPGARPVLAGRVTVLRDMRRFDRDSAIAVLADAVRAGDAGRALEVLGSGADDVGWITPDDTDGLEELTLDLVSVGVEQVAAAQRSDVADALEASGSVKVLAATRRGPLGIGDWTERIERGVAARSDGYRPDRRWTVGRPVLVTANDRANRVFNGDTGVVVAGVDGPEVALRSGDGHWMVVPSRLDRVESWWAMTIHKSQGSEFSHVVVSLPPAGSPILTRELLYTAVTRAKDQLTIVGSRESVAAAIARPVARASGLWDRLWPA